VLNSDFTGSLRIQGSVAPGRFPIINLNGHKITVDSEGIEVLPGAVGIHLSGGILTSREDFLKTHFSTNQISGYNYIHMDLVIADSDHQVGLRITGNEPEDAGFYMDGNQSNTFTGKVEISGRRKHLVLNKSNGAIAVRNDILSRNGAILRFTQSNQLLNTSSVTLKTHGVLQILSDFNTTNKFKNLIIEGSGIVHFNHEEKDSKNSHYYIKVDDIVVNQIGHLEIRGWQEGRDFLLVRKNSTNLADALKKMTFAGYDPRQIHLEDFDEEYWAISSTPEPETYGITLSAFGLGLWTWKRRKPQHQKQAP